MADYGMVGSAPGYDVETSVDFLQTFSSSWPLMKIGYSGLATINLNATPQTIFTHDLGYPAAYFIIGSLLGSTSPVLSVPAITRGIGINSSILGYDGGFPLGGTYTFYYYIIRQSLISNFTAPNITGSNLQANTNDNYGIKVTKPGKSTDSTDLRDFSLYSSSRSLMINNVDYGSSTLSGGYYQRTFTHNLNYLPIAFAYAQLGTNTSGYAPDFFYMLDNDNSGVAVSSYDINSTAINMRTDSFFVSQATNFSAVVLKDPFFKQTVNVNYP